MVLFLERRKNLVVFNEDVFLSYIILQIALQEASALFMIIKQQPGQGVLAALQPSIDALVERNLLKHKDKDIQVLVASCISEVLRIVAPDAPFTDEIWEVTSFGGISKQSDQNMF